MAKSAEPKQKDVTRSLKRCASPAFCLDEFIAGLQKEQEIDPTIEWNPPVGSEFGAPGELENPPGKKR
ncbi:hypothetical protein J5T34_17280 [Cupriavidus gilardii]|uniref:hypothetical protein n=1 Tax=Cupriavidus gilardii TaxID=82541 RepID=UPI001ABE9113|nr:hypothetical protein [Cupriavidus gilardii]MBO4122482.1 hypothetical protein [Cupriavidus gilardii]